MFLLPDQVGNAILLREVFDLTIGENIRTLRKEMKLTQQALADKTGIPVRTIINYENSGREPNAKNMAILEQFFCVSGAYLRGESTERMPEYAWDDPEIMDAIRDSVHTLVSETELALREVSDEEQKLVFDMLVELCHTLKQKDDVQRRGALRLFHDMAPAVLRWSGRKPSDTETQE